MQNNSEGVAPSKLVTLSDLFKFKVFRMPDYQRGYAWASKKESKPLNDLWNDLENVSEDAFHFTGVITLEKITEKSKFRWEKEFIISESLFASISQKEYKPYFVVDGQQRLVSLMILLSLLSKEEEILDKKNEASEFISIQENEKTFYLFGYKKRYSFSRIFDWKYI